MPETDELTERARTLVEGAGPGWTFRLEGPWAYVGLTDTLLPEQGWKLHVSATEGSATAVLSAVVPVLLSAGAPFKFAAAHRWVRMLNSATAARASGGKFITVYPLDDAQAVQLAEACHQATAGLPGPVILSDRPYRPGSLVHYRYGGFYDQHAIDADGMVVHLIRDPEGALVPDERRAEYHAPAWAPDPFQPPTAPGERTTPAPAPAPAGPVLLNNRYLVRVALRHANKGGTYLAEDQLRGVHVVLKEGRPHVAGSATGEDARDRVRHEARMLELAGTTGRVPALVEVFEQGGHVFMVEDHVPAPTLRGVVADAFDPPEPGLDPAEIADLAARLAETMADLHRAGVVLRDFNPNNVLVSGNGDLTLIDLELAYPVGEAPAMPAGTPGYASPEQLQGEPSGVADDHWSLGATIAYLATGADPYLPADVAHTWTDPDRLEAWMVRLVRSGRVDPAIAALVLGCMAARPADRLGPADVLVALATPGRPVSRDRTASSSHRPIRTEPTEPAQIPASVTDWLLDTMGNGTSGHLWPAGPNGIPLDPANVQSGASGVGLFLCQAARTLDDPRLPGAVSATAAWVSERVARGPKRPPGLYFGLSGVAWFLTEAAAVLARDDLLRRANELALTLPLESANPDFAHGTAGVGLGQLHQWTWTGDDRFLARAAAAAEQLVHTVERSTWTVPASAPSRLAGSTSYGFAHGSAGIATFLLYAAAATGEDSFRRVGLDALDALLPLAVEDDDGAAFWPMGPDDDELWPHWCNGSSGIGTAMLRAHAATGEDRYLHAAQAAALAGLRERWRSSSVQCHGLAGDAELLLDLAVFTGEARWSALAAEAAEVLLLSRRNDGKHAVFADDTGGGVSAGFGTGVAGVGAFFLRLVAGGSRPLMLDELVAR